MSNKILMIDPPSGWKYGFPKPYTKPKKMSLVEWLIKQGYPKEEAEFASKYSRYWEIDDNSNNT